MKRCLVTNVEPSITGYGSNHFLQRLIRNTGGKGAGKKDAHREFSRHGRRAERGGVMGKRRKPAELTLTAPAGYGGLVTEISELLDQARRGVARTANSILAAAYWEIGRRIVEYEQGGRERAEYGEQLLKTLARDLKARYGRGFSKRNLELMR